MKKISFTMEQMNFLLETGKQCSDDFRNNNVLGAAIHFNTLFINLGHIKSMSMKENDDVGKLQTMD